MAEEGNENIAILDHDTDRRKLNLEYTFAGFTLVYIIIAVWKPEITSALLENLHKRDKIV